ncbi:MAG: cell division protein SepF [Geodermatophilaceae bacterium]
MASAMRKMGIYLGLVEEEDRQPEDSAYAADQEQDGEWSTGQSWKSGQQSWPAAAGQGYGDEPAPVLRRPRPERSARPGKSWPQGGAATSSVDVYETRPAAAEASAYRITTLHPRTYNEARTIGEHFREGVPVIMNLTEMDDSDAKRLVDFAAGLSFGLRGSIERVTNKVFLLSPQNVSVTAEDKARIVEGGFFNQS